MSSDKSSIPPSKPIDCAKFTIKTHIASPIPSVISTLAIGDILNVVLAPPRGPVQLITKDGTVAGALLSIEINTLIECINDGHSFIAKVIENKGGNCQVLIKHV